MDRVKLPNHIFDCLDKISKQCTALYESIDELSYMVCAEDDGKKQLELPSEEDAKTVSLEEVRSVLADKSRDGFTEEVRALVRKYGACRLSEMDSRYYSQVLKEAEGIGNAR